MRRPLQAFRELNVQVPIPFHLCIRWRGWLQPEQLSGVIAQIALQIFFAQIEALWIVTTQYFEHVDPHTRFVGRGVRAEHQAIFGHLTGKFDQAKIAALEPSGNHSLTM